VVQGTQRNSGPVYALGPSQLLPSAGKGRGATPLRCSNHGQDARALLCDVRKWLIACSIGVFVKVLHSSAVQAEMFGVKVQSGPLSGHASTHGPMKRTQSPIVTGTSVLGIKVRHAHSDPFTSLVVNMLFIHIARANAH
jgi:hypothetical protein